MTQRLTGSAGASRNDATFEIGDYNFTLGPTDISVTHNVSFHNVFLILINIIFEVVFTK